MEHEQAQPEAAPEQAGVEEPEHAQPLVGTRLQCPNSVVLVAHRSPFAGMTQIRFGGCDLSPVVRQRHGLGHPGCLGASGVAERGSPANS